MSDHNPYQAPEADLPTQQLDTNDQELADRGTRLGAALIDGVIALVVMVPVLFLTGYISRAMDGTVSLTDIALSQLAGIGIYFALHGYLLSKNGQTIGKKLLNIRIVSHADGQLISLGAIIGKRVVPIWVISIVPFVGAIVGLIDPLMIFRADRRCLHDS